MSHPSFFQTRPSYAAAALLSDLVFGHKTLREALPSTTTSFLSCFRLEQRSPQQAIAVNFRFFAKEFMVVFSVLVVGTGERDTYAVTFEKFN